MPKINLNGLSHSELSSAMGRYEVSDREKFYACIENETENLIEKLVF